MSVVTAIAPIAINQLAYPREMYLVIAMVGIVYASFENYRRVVVMVPDSISALDGGSKLQLALVEGSLYDFSLDEHPSPWYDGTTRRPHGKA